MTAGTIFQDSHLPLRVWFRAMWLVTSRKTCISALGLQRALGLRSYESAWSCLQRLRSAMVGAGGEPLQGEVEVDETRIGGRENGFRDRTLGEQSVVIIAAETRGHGIGEIRIERGESSQGALVRFVRAHVSLGSRVITHGLPLNGELTEIGYRHDGVSPSLPRVRRVAALMRRWVLGVSPGYKSGDRLDQCLDEFAFRFNQGALARRGMLFHPLVQQAVSMAPAK